MRVCVENIFTVNKEISICYFVYSVCHLLWIKTFVANYVQILFHSYTLMGVALDKNT